MKAPVFKVCLCLILFCFNSCQWFYKDDKDDVPAPKTFTYEGYWYRVGNPIDGPAPERVQIIKVDAITYILKEAVPNREFILKNTYMPGGMWVVNKIYTCQEDPNKSHMVSVYPDDFANIDVLIPDTECLNLTGYFHKYERR
jgi:hypothetical protein